MLYKVLDFSQDTDPVRGRKNHELVLALVTVPSNRGGEILGTIAQKEATTESFMSHLIRDTVHFLIEKKSLCYMVGL